MLTVVTGPPCAGKTTYVREHASPGDIVIDYDELVAALTIPGVSPYDAPRDVHVVAQHARRAAVTSALHSPADVWIIDCLPTPERLAEYRMVRARMIPLDPGIDVCLERARNARPAGYEQIVERHYATR